MNAILTLSAGFAMANNVERFSLHCFVSVLTLELLTILAACLFDLDIYLNIDSVCLLPAPILCLL